VVGNPLKFAGQPTHEHAYPHRLGTDTGAVLRELLDLPEEEVTSLARQGVIGLG
jgi:crotonobetainyl-CoA:carnitine CoA-transferase CaiB-like acyl-CoA transferase